MRIGAVLCVRNEQHLIEEWVAHHLTLGVERIHVFDHMSTDNTRKKLECIHATYPGVTTEAWNPPADVQRLAYNRGLEIMSEEEVDWCMFIDADEFIGHGALVFETLSEMLARHATHCAVALNWAVFGSSGRIGPPSGLLQEAFLYRADETFPPNRHVKSIVRPKYTMGAFHAHGFSLDHPYFTPSGEEVLWEIPHAYTKSLPDLEGWRINHYFCQWRERWDAKIQRSRVRGSDAIARTESDWEEHDRNEVFDPGALRWTARDKMLMGTFIA